MSTRGIALAVIRGTPNENPVKSDHTCRATDGRWRVRDGMFGLALRPVVETINSDVRVPTLPPDVLVLKG
jgi:hypothetical protein